jgi:hypothetical protein
VLDFAKICPIPTKTSRFRIEINGDYSYINASTIEAIASFVGLSVEKSTRGAQGMAHPFSILSVIKAS